MNRYNNIKAMLLLQQRYGQAEKIQLDNKNVILQFKNK